MANEHSSTTAWVLGKLTLNEAAVSLMFHALPYSHLVDTSADLDCVHHLGYHVTSLSTPDLPGVSLWWLQDTEFQDPRVYLHCNLNTSYAETTAQWSGRNKLQYKVTVHVCHSNS